ncbi:bifunctional methylenetetrahydrofolate dehydrogenase/methenyltetrahydrofolate cyclohydrolase FolD [Pseudomonas sp. P115]|uniref:bifunctional 5,10-methylenetetrahydrofolate dehydrogenase/5,10-methenyltetrahydrofolate cyclohydrolase n=1 Tax=Pseudomonas pisciculturae TaxID=2730413 RepID=UPI00135893B0|nr:bifunctional methylenetetrahydrofolate dehydrogenase/methenyltetrahydrofolate cyclohydrolase FolD [Pseudomonas pisciculturae]MBF6029820.1 bifunctional methylenetetrahydrofolate dehydrogenase/methenyltetrahydrofolate cyclohydrolase FolD [Pseudomonas pisciculturae]
MATLIDGKAAAAQLNQASQQIVLQLKDKFGLTPALAVVLVGQDPASQVYVRNKILQAEQAGIHSIEKRFDADLDTDTLMTVIEGLNNDPTVNGILVQLPLPAHIDAAKVIAGIAAHKDVDGFHITNTGLLMTGEGRPLMPCTPQGCVILAKQYLGDNLSGKHAVVLGRSNIVGKPLAIMLLQENCTVTIAHSRTADLEGVCRSADILFVAVGRPQLVKGSWIKPGATVIDVGINRIRVSEHGSRLVGDVDFESALDVAGAITPVPGGVGPMTIACLLRNTLVAACDQHGIDGAEAGL